MTNFIILDRGAVYHINLCKLMVIVKYDDVKKEVYYFDTEDVNMFNFESLDTFVSKVNSLNYICNGTSMSFLNNFTTIFENDSNNRNLNLYYLAINNII